jgi:hypothetical protein
VSSDPQGLATFVLRYLEWLQVHNYAAPTARTSERLMALNPRIRG